MFKGITRKQGVTASGLLAVSLITCGGPPPESSTSKNSGACQSATILNIVTGVLMALPPMSMVQLASGIEMEKVCAHRLGPVATQH